MTGVVLDKSQSWWYANGGMTLIELLVALVIFAVLGVMGYRATSMAMETRQRVAAELQRWREISNFLQIFETDLAQLIERPHPGSPTVDASTALLSLKSGDSSTELSFLKLDGAGGNVRRRGYRFEQQQIVQLRWPGSDALSSQEPYVVLGNVTAVHCFAVGAKGERQPNWPDSAAGNTANPVAIEIELELPDVGSVSRLVPLR
jgi:general secretion pathway protein J